MEKETIQHITYASVIILVVVSLVLYQNHITTQTRNVLTEQITNLSTSLKATQNELKTQTEQLKVNDETLEASITKLGADLEKKDTQIRSLSGQLEDVKTQSEKQVSDLESKVTSLKAQYQDFSDIIDQVVPSVVSVQTNSGLGSGFFIRKEGYIVTNNHVIEGATAGKILTSNGKSHSVRIVGTNPSADLAVLKIEGTFPRLRFGSSNQARVGEKVIAVGSPSGLDFTVTQGIVSATNREIKGNQYIQIDVAINPGNSGGPLINTQGEVIGVNTLKISGTEGLGFAITSDHAQDIVDDMIKADQVS